MQKATVKQTTPILSCRRVVLPSLLVAFHPWRSRSFVDTWKCFPNLILFIISYQPQIIPFFTSPALAGDVWQHCISVGWPCLDSWHKQRNPMQPEWGRHCQGLSLILTFHEPRCCHHPLSNRKVHTPRLEHRLRRLQRFTAQLCASLARLEQVPALPEFETHICKWGS